MAPRDFLTVAGLALSLIGAAVSGYLTVEHGRDASPICAFGQGCEVVARSGYAHVGAIPTAAFGLLMYLGLAVLHAVPMAAAAPPTVERAFRLAAVAVALAGTGVSAWLTYVELYVLHAVCVWCVASAATVALLLVVAVANCVLGQRAPRGMAMAGRALPQGNP